ncbi:MAG TPA: hypothetical protein DD473_11310 [Planctomycetaceae bacterium]|nr:hypothetical protein [Planctomycetaceae bacterium]
MVFECGEHVLPLFICQHMVIWNNACVLLQLDRKHKTRNQRTPILNLFPVPFQGLDLGIK